MTDKPLLTVSVRGKNYTVRPQNHLSFWQQVNSGQWEPHTFDIFDRFLDPKGAYVDIGSWIGPTLLYARQIAKAAYGIEPDPISFPELEQNVRLNDGIGSPVHLFRGCIATQTGVEHVGSLGEGGDSMSSLLFGDCKTSWTVKSLTFQDFIAQHTVEDISFIKMDIEGGEFELIPHMLSFLRRERPTLYLSLHPCFLVPPERDTLMGKLLRAARTAHKSFSLLWRLRFYRFLYSESGKPLGLIGILWLCRRGSFSVLATDRPWTD